MGSGKRKISLLRGGRYLRVNTSLFQSFKHISFPQTAVNDGQKHLTFQITNKTNEVWASYK